MPLYNRWNKKFATNSIEDHKFGHNIILFHQICLKLNSHIRQKVSTWIPELTTLTSWTPVAPGIIEQVLNRRTPRFQVLRFLLSTGEKIRSPTGEYIRRLRPWIQAWGRPGLVNGFGILKSCGPGGMVHLSWGPRTNSQLGQTVV